MRAFAALLIAAASLAAMSTARAAEEKPDPAALSLAKTFAKVCILAIPDFQNVMVTARIEGWKQVEGPTPDKPVHWKGPPARSTWVMKGVDDLPVAVTISRVPHPNVAAMEATCAVQNPDVMPGGMANALAAVLPLPEPAKPVVKSDRTGTVWSFMWGNRTVALAMIARVSQEPGIILSAEIEQNVH